MTPSRTWLFFWAVKLFLLETLRGSRNLFLGNVVQEAYSWRRYSAHILPKLDGNSFGTTHVGVVVKFGTERTA